jgi:predicted glycosyltransferase
LLTPWKLNITLLSNLWAKEAITSEIGKYFDACLVSVKPQVQNPGTITKTKTKIKTHFPKTQKKKKNILS